jgi:rhamnosyltransferase
MKVLVILASFNGEKYIYDQINSILSQKDVYLDIFVFDDKSSDSTVEVVRKFSKSNVTVFVNQVPSGSAANNFCNSILSISDDTYRNYDFVALSDQDDIWHGNKLIRAVDNLKNNNSSLYASNMLLWDENTGRESIIKKDFPQKEFDFLFEGGSAGCTYVFTTDFAISLKKVLLNVNYLDWDNFSHDWFIYFFARYAGFKVTLDSNSFIRYRIHTQNVHGQLNSNSWRSLKKRFSLVKNGWYFGHIEGFRQIIKPDSVCNYIYHFYDFSWFTRVWVCLRFNFKLFRSKRKFLFFFLLSLIPYHKKTI